MCVCVGGELPKCVCMCVCACVAVCVCMDVWLGMCVCVCVWVWVWVSGCVHFRVHIFFMDAPLSESRFPFKLARGLPKNLNLTDSFLINVTGSWVST